MSALNKINSKAKRQKLNMFIYLDGVLSMMVHMWLELPLLSIIKNADKTQFTAVNQRFILDRMDINTHPSI